MIANVVRTYWGESPKRTRGQSPRSFGALSPTVRRFVASSIAIACGASQPGSPEDPITAEGTLVALPSMIESRAAHTATTLPDGRVLIVGGLSAGGSAELFDPATRRFSA